MTTKKMFILVLSIQVFGWRLGVQVATPNLPFMWDVRVVKARTWIAQVFSVHSGLRIQRGCQQATLWEWLCACTQDVFERCWVCFSQGGERGRERVRFFRLSHLWTLASRHALVNCRRFLAGQFFWSGDVSRCAFVSRVPCASTGLGSKIVCFIDEKVA